MAYKKYQSLFLKFISLNIGKKLGQKGCTNEETPSFHKEFKEPSRITASNPTPATIRTWNLLEGRGRLDHVPEKKRSPKNHSMGKKQGNPASGGCGRKREKTMCAMPNHEGTGGDLSPRT